MSSMGVQISRRLLMVEDQKEQVDHPDEISLHALGDTVYLQVVSTDA